MNRCGRSRPHLAFLPKPEPAGNITALRFGVLLILPQPFLSAFILASDAVRSTNLFPFMYQVAQRTRGTLVHLLHDGF
jgi:hypothetical protein